MTKQAGSTQAFIIHILLAAVGCIALPAYCQMPKQDDKEAIERLHQQDVQATLSDSADELAKLWDAGAVRLQAGGPAEVSKSVIYADDKHWQANLRGGKT